jgi:hypothetical protein
VALTSIEEIGMAVLRLQTVPFGRPENPLCLRDEQGREQTVPLLRLLMSVSFGKDPPVRTPDERKQYRAILDTGAPLTVIPKRIWQDFPSEITRLQVVSGPRLVASVGGRQFPFFFGRVWMSGFDPFGHRLPAVPVLAQFREDEIPLTEPQAPILLGLWGGILDGRSLRRWPTAERFDADLPTLESYGQW